MLFTLILAHMAPGTVPIAGLYVNLKTAIGKTLNKLVNAVLITL